MRNVRDGRSGRTFLALGLVFALAAVPAGGSDLRDLYFGEALYHAYQGRYFEALQRLDTELNLHRGLDEPQRDTLNYHIKNAEFSVGDFELQYRMHLRAGRAIEAVFDAAVEEAVRNEAAYRLARIHFQKSQFDEALSALARIQGQAPDEVKDDIEFLRANIYLATGKAAEAAKVLQQVPGNENLTGFIAYNLGIALLEDGRAPEAIVQLDKAGQLPGRDPAGLAIRDKSNLVLGAILFEAGDFERANRSLDRIRLDGPFANQVLLRAGYSEASAKHYERALIPWSVLLDREPTDVAVQEAMLAVPHAYASLNLHGRAALAYGKAVELFSNQIEKVDASIGSIKAGSFLQALIREEARQDEGWVISLRTLPDAPETFYLMELMASHDFQTALHNYLDLEELRSRLSESDASLQAFDEIVRLRAQNYEPLLPEIDEEFRTLDTRMRLRLEERKQMGRRLQSMLTSPRPAYLATAEELDAAESLARIERQLGDSASPEADAFRQRVALLRGALKWRQETEYQERFTRAQALLKESNSDIETLSRRYNEFVRARQAATHSYAGYDVQIAGLRDRVAEALQRVQTLMSEQGNIIEATAIQQLEARRERLVLQHSQARFGVADSYDRAVRAQSPAEGKAGSE
jgi:predicted negative regulator of RcsB-dependent stress response